VNPTWQRVLIFVAAVALIFAIYMLLYQ